MADVDLSESSAPTVHLTQLCRQFVQMDNQVTVAVPKPHRGMARHTRTGKLETQKAGDPESRKALRSCKLVCLPRPNIRLVGTMVFGIGLALWLLYRIASSRVHVIYERFAGSCLLASCVSLLMRRPHIVEVNGLPSGSFFSHVATWIRMRAPGCAAAIICTAQGYKSSLTKEYGIPPQKIFVLPMGVNEELFYPRNRAMCINELGLDPGRRYIGYVGSFYPKHDLGTLIRSMKMVAGKRRDVDLILVGNGWGAAKCRELVAELELERSVKFVGSVDLSAVPKYLGAIDIAVIPLAKSCVAISGIGSAKLAEYLACDCTVVATDIPGSETYDSFREFVYIVPPEDPTAMADAFIHLLPDSGRGTERHLRSLSARNGRQYILSHRTWRHIAIRTLRIAGAALRDRQGKREPESQRR